MIISPEQYIRLKAAHRDELEKTLKEEKLSLLSIYLDQSEQLLEYIKSLTAAELSNPERLIEKLARFDVELDGFNSKIFPEIQAKQTKLIDLGYGHTADYILEGFGRFRIPETFRLIDYKDILDELIKPIADSPFILSESIWGDDKREGIYSFINVAAKTRKSPYEMVKALEDYLTNSKQSGQFYKANRVVETELQRAYNRSSIKSTRDYNSRYSERLLFVRETSPAHKVSDICDTLAGAYDAESSLPDTPHPLCICLVSRRFSSDYSGKVINLGKSSIFYDDKYDQSAFLI